MNMLVSAERMRYGVALLIKLVKTYRLRFGAYPKAILSDQIYRNRKNRGFCKQHGIRSSGSRLGGSKARALAVCVTFPQRFCKIKADVDILR